MNKLFGHLPFIVVYIDDILVYSSSLEEHKEHFLQVIKVLINNGIILSPKKIELFKTEIDFLGKKILNGKIELQNYIYEKIQTFPDDINSLKTSKLFWDY